MNELITGFSGLNNVNLVDKARHIIASLQEEPASTDYPTPSPDLLTLTGAADNLAAALAKTTSVPVTEERNSLRVPLIQYLQLLAMNLETTTPGDRSKLVYTGFDLRKIAEHTHQVPETPLNIQVIATGQNGGFKAKCSATPHTDFYEFETTADPVNGPWSTPIPTTNSQNMHGEGFPRGSDIYIHVRAVNTNGHSPWSEIGDTMVA